jgi:hypothetical protein
MPPPFLKAIKFAASPTGRKFVSRAVQVARTEEGRKLISQARKVATSPEGRKLIEQVRNVAKQPAETAKATAGQRRVEAIRSRIRSRKP